MRRHFGASFACTAWVLGGIILSEPPRPPVTFAVVRQDGILIPFATFDGQWKNRWPEPSAEVEVPITTADVPRGWWPNKRPQIEWTLWEDGAPRRLAVTAPAWVPVYCLSNVGLRTDFKSDTLLPAPDTAPYPKVGLATSGADHAVSVAPITVLNAWFTDWTDVLAGLPAAFNEAERQALADSPWSVFIPRLPHAPIELEALYRAADFVPGRFIYYFEAARRYPGRYPLTEPSCGLMTFVQGWLRAGEGRHDVWIASAITDCYRSNLNFLLPLATVTVPGGGPVWVVQWSNWESEWYSIIDFRHPLGPRHLLQALGGLCP